MGWAAVGVQPSPALSFHPWPGPAETHVLVLEWSYTAGLVAAIPRDEVAENSFPSDPALSDMAPDVARSSGSSTVLESLPRASSGYNT